MNGVSLLQGGATLIGAAVFLVMHASGVSGMHSSFIFTDTTGIGDTIRYHDVDNDGSLTTKEFVKGFANWAYNEKQVHILLGSASFCARALSIHNFCVLNNLLGPF